MGRTLGILPAALLLATGCGEASLDQAEEVEAAGDPLPESASEVRAFTNATIFDGTGAPLIEDGVIVSRGGLITQVGGAAEVDVPDGVEVTDLGGRWLVPGFINAHGHVDQTGDRSSVSEQLEIYAHYGVTTVVSLGENDTGALELRSERSSPDLQRSRIFAAGPVLGPSSPDAARAEVARTSEMDVDWIKIRVDDALGQGTKMSPDVYRAVISTARELELPVAIHIVDLEDAKGVVRAGGSLVAHSVRDQPVDQELIDLMLERGVCLVPTFTRELSTFVYSERPDFFDDAFFLERSAPTDLTGFLTPQRRAQAEGSSAQYWREALPVAMENMRKLHEAGVGIAMGTDSGPAGRFQGYFEHLEMEMMVQGGLTPEEVLVSATGEAARCTGLAGTVGTIEDGSWADFVVLNANPLDDILNTREIHSVWIAANQVR
jgi:imidazolonepropionase-like amidohydrolase